MLAHLDTVVEDINGADIAAGARLWRSPAAAPALGRQAAPGPLDPAALRSHDENDPAG